MMCVCVCGEGTQGRNTVGKNPQAHNVLPGVAAKLKHEPMARFTPTPQLPLAHGSHVRLVHGNSAGNQKGNVYVCQSTYMHEWQHMYVCFLCACKRVCVCASMSV